jgi:chitinase
MKLRRIALVGALATSLGAIGCAGDATGPDDGSPSPTQPAAERWLLGYYVGYQRGLYPEASVDFSLMTHVVVGRIRPAADGGVVTDFDVDPVTGPQMARTLTTRAHAAGRKAILMLGGAGEHGGFVGAATEANRARFVANLLRVVDDLGFDGLDVDWEPIEDADRAPLLALLRALRTARPTLLLTVPVGWANPNFGAVDRWYATLAAAVDRVNLMSYDMAAPWPGWVTWHHSALDGHGGDHPSSVASSTELYLEAGVPAAKLGIGLGFYGSCWRGATGPRQAIGSGTSLVATDNVMSYANIMAQYHDPAARQWDASAQVPYLSFTSPRGPQRCTFVSYEDEQSVAAKGAYVKSKGLGGAIVWTINEGHLGSAPAGSQDPLLKAAYTSMVP